MHTLCETLEELDISRSVHILAVASAAGFCVWPLTSDGNLVQLSAETEEGAILNFAFCLSFGMYTANNLHSIDDNYSKTQNIAIEYRSYISAPRMAI